MKFNNLLCAPIFLCLLLISCINRETVAETDIPGKEQKMRFITLHLEKDSISNNIEVLNVEQETVGANFNALPLPPDRSPKDRFQCEVLDKKGELIMHVTQEATFNLNPLGSRAQTFVKFNFILPPGAEKARISHLGEDADPIILGIYNL